MPNENDSTVGRTTVCRLSIIIFDDAWNQNHLSVQREQSTHMNSQFRFICVSFWSCFLVGDRPFVMFLRCVPMVASLDQNKIVEYCVNSNFNPPNLVLQRHGIFNNKKFVAHDMQIHSFRIKSIQTRFAHSSPMEHIP